MQICHLHAGMPEAILFRLSGELIFVFHVERATRSHTNHRRRVVSLIPKFRFARDLIRCSDEFDRRGRLRKFGNHLALTVRRNNRQSHNCDPARCPKHHLLQNLHRENYPPVGGIATARARDFVMPRLGDALKAESIPDAWRSQPLPSGRAKKTFWSGVTLRIQHFALC